MAKEQYIRHDGTYTLAAFRKVETMAKDNKTQRSIAAELGIPYRALEAAMQKNKGDNELRLAWERGNAEVEQEVADFFYKRMKANDKNSVIAGIYFSKARFGWTDKDPVGSVVASNIQIVLPAAMSAEAYFKSLGLSAPEPANNIKNVTPAPKQLAPPVEGK